MPIGLKFTRNKILGARWNISLRKIVYQINKYHNQLNEIHSIQIVDLINTKDTWRNPTTVQGFACVGLDHSDGDTLKDLGHSHGKGLGIPAGTV